MDNAQQFELFQELEKAKSNKSLRPEGVSSPDFRRFKRAIFLVIYSIIVLIIGFAFGVEHGKNKALPQGVDNSAQTTALVIKTVKKEVRSPDKKLQVRAVTAGSPSSGADAKSKFSIKLASFKNLETAQREMAALKDKGYAAYLVTSKGFSKLYSGPFKTKEEAQSLLKNLKARYPDCFITK